MVLAPSTNSSYRGAASAVWFTLLAGLLELAAGAIHYFLPDGGAGVIAGIDLTHNARAIISVFAWFGALQMSFALLIIAIAVRYRTLVPLALGAISLSRLLMALDAWFLKGASAPHHPPEHFASPIVAGLALFFLILSLRTRGASGAKEQT